MAEGNERWVGEIIALDWIKICVASSINLMPLLFLKVHHNQGTDHNNNLQTFFLLTLTSGITVCSKNVSRKAKRLAKTERLTAARKWAFISECAAGGRDGMGCRAVDEGGELVESQDTDGRTDV